MTASYRTTPPPDNPRVNALLAEIERRKKNGTYLEGEEVKGANNARDDSPLKNGKVIKKGPKKKR